MKYEIKKPSFKDIIFFSKNIIGKLPVKEFMDTLKEKITEINKLNLIEAELQNRIKAGHKITNKEEKEQELRISKINSLSQEMLFDAVQLLFSNIEKIEGSLYEFFGKMSGMTADEFSELDFDIATDIIKEFFIQEGFYDFFKKASTL